MSTWVLVIALAGFNGSMAITTAPGFESAASCEAGASALKPWSGSSFSINTKCIEQPHVSQLSAAPPPCTIYADGVCIARSGFDCMADNAPLRFVACDKPKEISPPPEHLKDTGTGKCYAIHGDGLIPTPCKQTNSK